MKDWNYISENICYKDYDGHIHIRKLNLKTGKYSYLMLYDWELKDIKIIQEEPEKDRKYPKVVYQLGSDSSEYIELKKKFDKLTEEFLVKMKDIYFSLGDDKVENLMFAELKQEYEGRLKN